MRRNGFTPLEVMIAVAILGLSLTAIFSSGTGGLETKAFEPRSPCSSPANQTKRMPRRYRRPVAATARGRVSASAISAMRWKYAGPPRCTLKCRGLPGMFAPRYQELQLSAVSMVPSAISNTCRTQASSASMLGSMLLASV